MNDRDHTGDDTTHHAHDAGAPSAGEPLRREVALAVPSSPRPWMVAVLCGVTALSAGALALSLSLASRAGAHCEHHRVTVIERPARVQVPSARPFGMTWLGVQVRSLRDTGVLVTDVVPGTPAEQVGLAAGDVILEVEGEPIASSGALVDAVRRRDPGDQVALRVRRDGHLETVSAVLASTRRLPAPSRWPALVR